MQSLLQLSSVVFSHLDVTNCRCDNPDQMSLPSVAFTG